MNQNICRIFSYFFVLSESKTLKKEAKNIVSIYRLEMNVKVMVGLWHNEAIAHCQKLASAFMGHIEDFAMRA